MFTMRPTPKRLVKTFFCAIIVGLIFVNMSLLFHQEPPDLHGGPSSNDRDIDVPGKNLWQDLRPVSHRNNLSMLYTSKSSILNSYIHNHNHTQVHRHVIQDLITQINASSINETMYILNRRQVVINKDKFGDSLTEDSIVVVIQVHDRVDYLHYLLDSLRHAKDIENVLLVFSHDFYSQDINAVVDTVDFCRVIQIFYPYSMQLYPNEFPGKHPNDCPRDIKKNAAIAQKCNNAAYPDKYGHYREARVVQTKHHWFWKINHVFDNMDITAGYNGPVLLIEEDHYLAPDFVGVVHAMNSLRQRSCQDCSIMTIGGYDKQPVYGSLANAVDVTNWQSVKHNMGMAFTRDVWDKIKACAKEFCYFDDYNWDWSLQFIGVTCYPGRLKVMVAKSPRIFHIGTCGVHHKGKNCDPAGKIMQVNHVLTVNQGSLHPASLRIHGYPRASQRVPKPNGGWADIRDHNLCLKFTYITRWYSRL